MDNIKILRDSDQIDWNDVNNLFVAVKFGNRGADNLKKCFTTSMYKSFAYQNDTLVGFGRVLSDGIYYGAIYDVIVQPELQGKGIGKLIMRDIIAQTQHLLYITLFAAPGKMDFYKKLGFRKMSTGMLIPRNEKMEANYCE
jgi:ribosomal protein S18 acetylase RimI-like enzyme